MTGAVTNKVLSIVLNCSGTGADVPLSDYNAGAPEFANGQRPIEATSPCSRSPVPSSSSRGPACSSQAAADGPGLSAVALGAGARNTAPHIPVAETGLIVVDVGPV